MHRRHLTRGEVWLYERVFGSSFPTIKIEVVQRILISGGFTPRHIVNLDKGHYSHDFIGETYRKPTEKLSKVHFFLHELVHTWQHFCGVRIISEYAKAARHGKEHRKAHGEGSGSKFHSIYDYDPTNPRDLLDYTMEQQAEIIADYYMLQIYGYRNAHQSHHPGLPKPKVAQLETILTEFKKDRTYPIRQSKGHQCRAKRRAFDLT